MVNPVIQSQPRSRAFFVLVTVLMVISVGLVDYATNSEFSFSVFYLLALGLAGWFVGQGFAYFISVLSVLVSFTGDWFSGAGYSSTMVPLWNASAVLLFYFVVTLLVGRLRRMTLGLEAQVRERTVALTGEMAERERLEHAIMEIAARERQSIGHDLHDDLGQHLTGTALAGEVLDEKLHAKQLTEEKEDLRRIIELIEEGIEKTRRLAKGLLVAEVSPDAFSVALQELAREVTEGGRVNCTFRQEGVVSIGSPGAATHLFHVAQEAVRNAIRHGNARRIAIALVAASGEGVELSIGDDGGGLPPVSQRGQGLGLRIMAHRAGLIGWRFSVSTPPAGGTLVTCRSSPKGGEHA